jgi:hypothetical protein
MRNTLALLLTLAIFLTFQPANATTVYRYEWEALGQTTPASLGSPLSGYIDFLAPSSGSPYNFLGLSAIYDLQFTTASSLSVAPGAPYIPAATYTLADSTTTSTYVAWNHQEITYLQGLSFAGPNGVTGNISDSAMQTFFPFDYAPNEDYESGAWMFEGSITVAPTLANLSISDGGGTLLLLLIAAGSLAAYGFFHRLQTASR